MHVADDKRTGKTCLPRPAGYGPTASTNFRATPMARPRPALCALVAGMVVDAASDREGREVDLRLAAGGGLEAGLKGRDHWRPDHVQEVVALGAAAGIVSSRTWRSTRTPLSSGR